MFKNQKTLKLDLFTGISVVGIASCGVLGSPAIAATASFDSFPEGFSGTTITDGKITFFDLDQRLSDTASSPFLIESTTADQLGASFSPPNYLSPGGFSPGFGASFGRFGSTRITTGTIGEFASLDVFSLLFSPSNNILTLEAWLDENLVGSSSVALSSFEPVNTDGLVQQTLEISGVTFNQLRLVASGLDDDGVAFIGIDNVRVDEVISVPESTSALSILAIGVFGAGYIWQRKQSLLR